MLDLQWADVDWEGERIVWRSQWDKNGVEWDQPLRGPTKVLLQVAQRWHAGLGLDSRWVFPAPRGPMGRTTSKRFGGTSRLRSSGGIVHKPRRAGHGLRRLLAGEVNALTGDATLAMRSIGDRDIKQAMRYLKRRDARVRGAFDQLDEDRARAPHGSALGGCQRRRGGGSAGVRFDGEVLSLYRVRGGKLARAQMFYFDTASLVNFLALARGPAGVPG